MRYCGIAVLLYWTIFLAIAIFLAVSILDGIKSYPPSPPTFFEPFPVSNRTFPIKLTSHGDSKLQFLVSAIVKGILFCYLLTNTSMDVT